jgi:class 3 adenylate cyclase
VPASTTRRFPGGIKHRIYEPRVRSRVAGANPIRNSIQGGEVIVGDIGFRDHTVFTALGDAVNVAARLQDMTKQLNCTVVISEEVCTNANLPTDTLTRTEVAIRGRDQPMSVRTTSEPTLLTSLLNELTKLDTKAI